MMRSDPLSDRELKVLTFQQLHAAQDFSAGLGAGAQPAGAPPSSLRAIHLPARPSAYGEDRAA